MSSRILKPCAVCGKQMFLRPSHSSQRFCSLKCRDHGHSWDVTCDACGKVFRVEKNQAARGRKHCSKKCQYSKTTEERFWEKVDKDGPVPVHAPGIGNCWIWKSSVDELGYGFFRVAMDENMRKAHRVSWILRHGDPGKLLVCHRCDNPSCVRPDHLFLGTNLDNIRDRDAKGRGRSLYGENHPGAILRDADVLEIRSSDAPVEALSAKFGVAVGTVKHIQRRESWKHL